MSKPRPLIPVATILTTQFERRNDNKDCRYIPQCTYGEPYKPLCNLDCECWPIQAGNNLVPTEWVPTENAEWTGDLEVIGYHGSRGTTSYYEVRIYTNDGKLPVEGMMSCSSFVRLIARVVNGRASGTWCARKKGSNYYVIQERAQWPVEAI